VAENAGSVDANAGALLLATYQRASLGDGPAAPAVALMRASSWRALVALAGLACASFVLTWHLSFEGRHGKAGLRAASAS
jgi:hypothetical protein